MKELRITRARKVFSDGKHNAFTSVADFGGKRCLAFRSGSLHKSYDGEIVILHSNGDGWKIAARLRQPKYDLRDPKLIVFKNSLWLYCFARNSSEKYKFCLYNSENGKDFTRIKETNGIPSQYILWGFKAHQGELFATGYRERDRYFYVSLFKSCDGVNWRKIFDFPEPGTETPIDFDEDGSMWALSRDDNFVNNIPTLYRLSPPYTEICEKSRLPVRIHGPMLKRLNGGSVIIARRWDTPGRHNLRSDVFILEDGKDIRFVCTLPSGGDNSYASWLDLESGKAIVAYYSSHEHKMDKAFDEKNENSTVEHSTPADIYVADVSYRFS
ncbi:MAG: hypothetical protein WC082_06370 [Victivallales bacterium]